GAVGLPEDFGSFRKGVVVFGGHGAAIGSGSADEAEVADFGNGKAAGGEDFGFAGGGCEDVARFAAMADDEVVAGCGGGAFLEKLNAMLRAVKGRAQDLGHPGIQFNEMGAVVA